MPQYYPAETGDTKFDGMVDTVELAGGLVLHRVDARDIRGAAIEGFVKPGLRLGLVVGGKIEVVIGGRRLLMGPQAEGGMRGAVISVTEPATFLRRSNRGDVERTVSLTMSADWLQTRLGEESAASIEFAQRHLSVCPWNISAKAAAVVEEMLSPPGLSSSLWRMYQESRALELVVEALANVEGATSTLAATGLRKRDRVRMEHVRDLLDSGEADALSLDEIAQRICVSANTLQRHFSAVWGVTVVAYLRESRLARAHQALERDGVSVAYAAWLAGYSCPANFATAFRRRYGVRPGQVGARVAVK